MSAVVPLAVGEVLVPKPGSAWSYNYTHVKVLAETEKNGRKYYWLEMTPKGGSTFFDSLREDSIRAGWQRKPSFFEMGKTYKFKSGLRVDTWKILDLYQVDRPTYGKGKKAVARMTDSLGREDVQTLSESDFERMVEVK